MTFTPAADFTTRPTLTGSFGMAATTHWLASSCAMAVLERDGNAFDAAVAAGFVLHVVEPNLNGIAGEMVAIVATASDPRPRVLAGTGSAPAAATIEQFRSLGLPAVPGGGLLPAAVPGQFDAWMLLLRDHGTWQLGDVLSFAITYAQRGILVGPKLHDTIRSVQRIFEQHWPTSHAKWMPGGQVPPVGALLTNTAYAETLERLTRSGDRLPSREQRIDHARRMWSEGFVAEEILAFSETPQWSPDGGHHRGLLRASDLAAYSATFEAAVTADFRGHTIAKAGPWTQGPVLLQTLGLLSAFDTTSLDPSNADGAHVILESIKLAMADREAYFGDGDVPLDTLLSSGYIDDRRRLVGERASHEFRPGQVTGYRAYEPPLMEQQSAGELTGEPTVALPARPLSSATGEVRGDTCHLDIVDRWGNMISATPSGGWLQSSPHIPQLGFCLGTRLQQCWLDPDSPSALAPGRRPRITLTPTMVLRGGQPVAAIGTPGGDGQDQWQLQYLLRTIVGGYQPQQAIDAPVFSSTSFPESFWPRAWVPGGVLVEDRIGRDVIAALTRRGHRITLAGDWSLGRLSAVTRDPENGMLAAAANPRGAQGYAVGR